MAKIRNSSNDLIASIPRWLGVNESPDGDTNLKTGEASAITNFKITNDGSLQKRPGTQNVANLLTGYTKAYGDITTVQAEINKATATYTLYPSLRETEGGIFALDGAGIAVNAASAAPYAGYYWQSQSGAIYRFEQCEYVNHDGATHVTGGWITYGDEIQTGEGTGWSTGSTTGVNVVNGALFHGALTNKSHSDFSYGEIFYRWLDSDGKGPPYAFSRYVTYPYWDPTRQEYIPLTIIYARQVLFLANDTWNWKFRPVTMVPNTNDSPVRGIWSGMVGDSEVMVAACNGCLWKLTVDDNGAWTKQNVASINTDKPVHFFPFNGKLYMLNGSQYLVWDGNNLLNVAGYVPLIAVSTVPAGGGTALQQINKLNGQRRVQFSPDGTAKTFQLPEKGLSSIDYVKNMATSINYTLATDYTINLTNGTVTFITAPVSGTNTVEIGYTFPTTYRLSVLAMMHSELFNGANDNRVFIYGDGSNQAFYSDLEHESGKPTAEYFPDLNVMSIGDSRTPIMSMVRHYDRLLAFKADSAYSIRYDTLTLVSGQDVAGFYISTVNKDIGGTGYGQALIVENRPRTLDGRSLYEWTATTTSGNISPDQRNAQRISQKVEVTLREIDFSKSLMFFDKINHEFYVVENGLAIVQNTENGTWYIYRDFPAICMIVYRDELYFGTSDGFIRHVSRNYRHDCGAPIQCYWESGSMDFGAANRKKTSDMLWVVLKPEDTAALTVTVQTDKQSDYEDLDVIENYSAAVASGYFDFLKLDFAHFSFNVNDKPHTQRRRLKVKNFTWYKLIFSTVSSDTTATVLHVDIKVRPTSMVR